MKKRNTILLPRAQKPISVLGENIKLARLRRKFSAEQVAERANISRPTLVSIEKGNPNVTIGAYVKVLSVLGLENDILEVAKDDKLGRKLQDAGLLVKKRAPKVSLVDENRWQRIFSICLFQTRMIIYGTMVLY